MDNTGYSRGKIGTVIRIGKVSYGRLAYVWGEIRFNQTRLGKYTLNFLKPG